MTGYFLWRRPARRRGGTWVLLPSTLGVAAFPAVLAITHHELAVAAIVGGYGICLAGIELALFDELMKSIPSDQAVRFAALDQGASNFAGMTGPIMGALLAAAIGIPAGLAAAGAVGLVGAGLFAASVVSRRGSARTDVPASPPVVEPTREAVAQEPVS
jgi:predicted MFS family arabinose efflux permease